MGATNGAQDSSRRRRILLVEGENGVSEAEQALVDGGYTVEVAEDVLAAMELISSFEPDLVVLDLGLPGSAPGLGVLEIVRTHHPGMRMVLLGERSNGAPAVPKPVDPDALLREVSQALATAPVA